MPERSFVHLHCHSHYSLLDGANRIPELVAHVKASGMNAIALTDHGNLYGAVEFYRECKAAGLNPVVGYEAYVAPNKRTDRDARRRGDAGFHLTLLARNRTGFKNLIKMASAAFLEGYYYVPRIDKELLAAHKEGVICLSGCASSEFSEFILKGQIDEATEVARRFAQLFGDKHFFVEIQNNGLDIQRQCLEGAVDIANRLGLPLVATSDAHYLRQEDAAAHEVLLCINTGKTLKDENRMRYGSDLFHVRAPGEMYGLFPGHEDAVQRSQEIANSCDLSLDFKARHFPVFVPPAGKAPEAYLRELCEEGLKVRYRGNPPQAARDRLEHELGVICRMGFASYFLIVSDFVRFALGHGIPASARGSACGALVSYVLQLSHVDPLEYDLLFERFLDPNRSEAPDIDIDFCQDRRDEVIAYVKQKYGEASVAQIATFGTMAARAAIKDVGRALDVPLDRVNQLTAMVPKTLGVTLDEALQQSTDLKAQYDNDPQVRRLIDIARRLEGTNRNAGTHAAGVVIANGPLTDYVPVHRVVRKGDDAGSKSGEAVVTTQWVMGDLEKVGLLKMDFLGLRTLTLLDKAVELVAKTRGEKIDIANLPLDDPESYQLLQRGDAKGVFQFESDGIRELLKRMKPDNIRDIIACTALYRPGPLGGGMVDAYVNRKHGREQPTYQHPIMEEILGETYGIMCIHEDARVSLADGSEKPIKQVRQGDRVHALNQETKRFEIKECHGCGPTRRGVGVQVTLENGFSVTLTEDHQVLTYQGMKEAKDLDPSVDLVATGLHLFQEESSTLEIAPWLGQGEDVAYFLGQLLGDGCLTSCGITLATGTRAHHETLVSWFTSRLPKLRPHGYFHGRSWYLSVSCDELLNAPGYGNRKTRLHHFLETLGLKKHAREKRVPDVIFRAPRAVRAAFMAGVLDSDGCFAKTDKGAGVCFLTSASPTLLQDVRRLCQLEGITVTLSKQRIQVWNLLALQQLVEPFLVLKGFVGRLTDGGTVGWLPRGAVYEAVPVGESLRAFCQRTGIQRRGLGHSFPFIKSSTARKAGIDLGDVRYFRVKSIARVEDQQFYGMSVADHHNLVANGVVVKNCYQEQVMRILNRLGGIELSSAYACIKAISKKKQEIIDQRRVDFLQGAQERGVSEVTSREIFDLITYFGGYGFNKSHSAAYALVSYQTAYLKTHYTPEFMAALLTSEIEDGNKRDIMVQHLDDARRLGAEVLPPDVNTDEADFSVSGSKILFGLTAIKGVGRNAAEEIARARKAKGPFKDLFDFCDRLDQKVVTKAAMERLIKAGAMDSFGARRSQLLAVLGAALQSAGELQEDRRHGQRNFFEALEESADAAAASRTALPDIPEWSDRDKLKYEKEVLDFYISSHPLSQHEGDILRFATHTTAQLADLQPNQEVILGGMLKEVRFMNTKKARNGNSRYVRCKVEDFHGTAECVMWPDDFVRYKDEFTEDRVCFVKGTVEKTREQPGLILTRVLSVEQAARELTKGLVLSLSYNPVEDPDCTQVEAVARALKRSPGNCPVFLVVVDGAGKRVLLKANQEYNINPAHLPLGELEELLGRGRVKFSAPANGRTANGRSAPATPG